jgi:hypothetical protein
MEAFSGKKIFSKTEIGEGCVLRRRLILGSVRSQKHLTIPSQMTFRMRVYPRRFVVVPAEKRVEREIHALLSGLLFCSKSF